MTDKDMEQLCKKFIQEATAVSAEVYREKDLAGAATRLEEIIREQKARKIVAAPSSMVMECLISVAAGEIAVHTRDLRRHAEDADIGFSEVDLAVAETGSVAQDCTDLDRRLVSTLPPVHVVLLPTTELVESFSDAVDTFGRHKAALPGYISFITGPSRTADIERVLTIGVHGPGQLRVILVDQPGGESGA